MSRCREVFCNQIKIFIRIRPNKTKKKKKRSKAYVDGLSKTWRGMGEVDYDVSPVGVITGPLSKLIDIAFAYIGF